MLHKYLGTEFTEVIESADQRCHGEKVPALDLFAHVIRYLKNHLLNVLDIKGTTVTNKDVHWVLPVPAIWKKSAKQFMREAANKVKVQKHEMCVGV